MKVLQNWLSIVVLAVLATLGYQFWGSGSLGQKVDEHGRRLETISGQSTRLEKDVSKQAQALDATQQRVEAHTTRIDAVEQRVQRAEAGLKVVEEDIKAARSASNELKERAERLEQDLGSLRENHNRLEKQLGDEHRARLHVDQAVEQRLKDLEKRLGVPPPPAP